jgi:hypothetical protein
MEIQYHTKLAKVYIPLEEGTPFLEGEVIDGEGIILTRFLDMEGDYFCFSYTDAPHPAPPELEFEDVPKEDLPSWL